jgi:hypothetical protein
MRALFWLFFFITLAFSFFVLILIGLIDNWVSLRPAPASAGSIDQNDEDGSNESDS